MSRRFLRALAALWYRLRQIPHHLREQAYKVFVDAQLAVETRLEAVLIRATGARVRLGLLGRRIVTNAGVAYIASAFTGVGAVSNMNYHDVGTGVTAAAVTQTALVTPAGTSRVAGTQSTVTTTVTGDTYQTVATISFTSTLAITEWGLFSASTSGTMLDRFTFSAINVNNGDSIQFTFKLSLPAGN